jgi:hypothetical protein
MTPNDGYEATIRRCTPVGGTPITALLHLTAASN